MVSTLLGNQYLENLVKYHFFVDDNNIKHYSKFLTSVILDKWHKREEKLKRMSGEEEKKQADGFDELDDIDLEPNTENWLGERLMSRRKRYIKGRVYKVNDSILTGHVKENRRVVATNNNPEEATVRRILTAGKGRNSQRGIPIEKYPDIRRKSVVENRTFRKAISGKPLKVKYMKKTKTRLNKWDAKKIGIK